ncbi:TFIIH subunit Tfb4/p34 [Cladochytrium replicatum]|nr:TFIIH subunit Tfb4/p34 [Cladochytrium replicatum]
MADGDLNLLVVVLDLNETQWSRAESDSTSPLSLTKCIEHLLVFINAHLSLSHDNRIAFIAAQPKSTSFLYPLPPDHPKLAFGKKPANVYQQFRETDGIIVEKLRELMNTDKGSADGTTMIAGAWSLALTYINRIRREDETRTTQARVLTISVSPDAADQYIPIMNCIFSAQKSVPHFEQRSGERLNTFIQGIKLDVCKVYGPESVFMPQAAHITGGVFLEITHRDELLQHLLYAFLAEPSIRTTLSLPGKDEVDFRAACFCHKKIVEVGFVCSVCLSIFCSYVPVCTTCRTKFSLASK